MPLLGGITSFLDKYILGYALGTAAGPALRPFVQDLANEAWTLNPVMRLDPITAGAVVAEDVRLRDWGAAEALNHGIDGERFDAIVGETLNAPGLETLYSLWRRNIINTGEFEHGLRKGKLETRWDAALEAAREILLSSDELANAQQQQFIDEARANEEAALQGVTAERQQIRFRLAGLPPGVETALQMLRRKIIDVGTFRQIVAEGHTKTKYTDDLLALEQVVLGAQTYAGLHLRGWIDEAAMVAGGELTGYDQAQMDLLYKEHGRPATGHQVLVGLRRGGVYDGPLTGIPQPFIDAIRQSNIRPEWTNILWHAVTNYPPLFQLTRLVQAQVIDATTGADWAYKQGSPNEVVTALREYWATGVSASGKEATKAELMAEFEGGYISENELRDHLTALGYSGPALDLEVHLGDARRIRSWRGKAETAISKVFIKGTIDEATARADLAELGLDADYIDRVLVIWKLEARL